ncbi:MAG TPA: octanoyltransferase [Gammaproteobacteria bacterium]|nr:octanoyltransferase [Gammaproteobacteria bacterium]
MSEPLVVRLLGRQSYESTWSDMKRFTRQRSPFITDELWLLEHPPVYTLGQAGKEMHILDAGDIEVVRCDRGGQVTYHGPGQLVGYLMADIGRQHIGIKELVCRIEKALVGVMSRVNIEAYANPDAHGVYVADKKIAALGLRVRKGCTYHGFSLNVDMDLEPFSRINPCGYAGLEVTDMVTEGGVFGNERLEDIVVQELIQTFGYVLDEKQRLVI